MYNMYNIYDKYSICNMYNIYAMKYGLLKLQQSAQLEQQ